MRIEQPAGGDVMARRARADRFLGPSVAQLEPPVNVLIQLLWLPLARGPRASEDVRAFVGGLQGEMFERLGCARLRERRVGSIFVPKTKATTSFA